jgi:hypothetical protein
MKSINTAKQELEATRALAFYLKDHEKATKSNAKAWLIEKGHSFNPGKGFNNRIWPEARSHAGLEKLARPGRQKKS